MRFKLHECYLDFKFTKMLSKFLKITKLSLKLSGAEGSLELAKTDQNGPKFGAKWNENVVCQVLH